MAEGGNAGYDRSMTDMILVVEAVVIGGLIFAASVALLSGGEW